jgi:hypothetical protein
MIPRKHIRKKTISEEQKDYYDYHKSKHLKNLRLLIPQFVFNLSQGWRYYDDVIRQCKISMVSELTHLLGQEVMIT